MLYFLIVSLSLFAAGIFFIPLNLIIPLLGLFLVLNLVFGFSEISSFLKNLAFLFILTLPIFLIKLFTIREGRIFSWWIFEIYSNALLDGITAVSRIFLLFLASFFLLKILFPIEKNREKYSRIRFFSVVFEAIELFPLILGEFVSLVKKRKETNEKFGERVISLIDNLYISLSKK
jgi:hypothetical protein